MVNLMGVVQQAAMLASVLLLTGYSGDKLMAVAVAYGVSALIVELVFSVIFFMKNRGWTPSFSMVSKKDALSVTGLGIQFFIVQIASLVLSTTDNIIVSNIFGPAAVTPYSTALKLFTVPVSLYVAVISPYWSSVTAQCATGDVTGVRRGIRRMQTLLWIVIVPCAILTIVFEPLTTLWLGQRLDMPAGLVWLNLIYAIIYSWNAIYSQVSNGMSMMRMMIAVAVLQAIVNIPLSFILASTIGSSSGVLLGTVLTMLLSAVVYPIYIKKRLKSMAAAGRSDGGIGK
jgi:O-antigen/teichoic acid export membrane protein